MLEAESILSEYFGHTAFRPLQKDIVESVLNGKDTIALLPTGGGKSVCFQVPALLMDGVCIVVTPLIALMKDQVENLKAKNISAVALYSGMSRHEIDFELENCVNGKTKFLYCSPERLMSANFLSYAIHMKICFLAIDEAHCISQWGYDFRPPYLNIVEFKNKFKGLKCIALTASATEAVVKDMADKLGLKDTAIFQKSFTRQNLSYVVQEEENKFEKIISICRKINGSGLVYVKSRKKTIEIAQLLQQHQISADYYHAGLESDLRTRKQEDWKNNKIRVMVCTNAFGMGIDKPDVRFVIHHQKPDTLEAYYQEAGRAGRDGEKSYCIALSHPVDFQEDQKNILNKYPSPKDIARVYELICNYLKIAVGSGKGQSYNFELNEMATYFNVPASLVYNALRILEADAYFQATEAVHLPSRMRILCSYTELYEWQLQNELVDALFKVLLRSYGGLFDFYTNIYEYEIAKRLRKPERWVREQLLKLKQIDIIDYIPQNNKAQLYFIENRLSSIHISEDRMAFLRQRYQQKLDEMNRYMQNKDTCRSVVLVQYFGEKNASPCGICDICLKQKKNLSPSDKFALYQEKIKPLLANNDFQLEHIKTKVKAEQTLEYLSILRWLKDHQYIEETAEGIWKWTGKK